jgi:hypothetical protein
MEGHFQVSAHNCKGYLALACSLRLLPNQYRASLKLNGKVVKLGFALSQPVDTCQCLWFVPHSLHQYSYFPKYQHLYCQHLGRQ